MSKLQRAVEVIIKAIECICLIASGIAFGRADISVSSLFLTVAILVWYIGILERKVKEGNSNGKRIK